MKSNCIIFAFLIFIFFTLFSCQKDLYNIVDVEAQNSVDDAKDWYENSKPQGVKLGFVKVKSTRKKKLNSKPDWEHAYAVNHTDFTSVQVPLSVQGAFAFVTPEHKKAYEETGDRRFVTTLTQMVVVTDKKSKKKTGFLMTIIPDVEYQKTTKFNSFHSSYKKWQKGYSGLIFYHTLDGVFTNGWRIANGKVVKTISSTTGGDIGVQLKTPGVQKASAGYECNYYFYELWSQDCTDWYRVSESSVYYTNTTCGDWYPDGYQYAYYECGFYDDFGDGGFQDTGGGANPQYDCNGDSGGSAYLDECQECVGGRTGKTPCDPCTEMNNELAAIYQDYQGGMMAVKRKVGTEVNIGPCCGAGYIQSANGNCILFSSISTANIYGSNSYTYTTKKSYTHDEALTYFIKERDISSAAGSYGLVFPAGTVLAGSLLDKIKDFSIKWGGKAGSLACVLATTYWEAFFQRQESIYQELHDNFSYSKYNGLGLYEVKRTIVMISPSGFSSSSTQVSYYTTDGCLFREVFY